MTGAYFSLILPIRNGMPGLKRTIGALERQSHSDFELIVQDAGSTDGSVDFLRQAKLPRIDIVSEPDNGIAQGYARTFRRCRYPLVVPVACDEWLDDNALSTFAAWHVQHPDAAYIYGGARLWKSETELHSVLHPGKYDLLKLLRSEFVPTMAGFFNRNVIGADFYLDEGLKTCPDFDIFTRLARRFDGRQIVEKRAVRFNAIIDRSSATYRPETFDQFALDRRYILDRFFVREGNCVLNDYVRRQCISSMYVRLAAALLEISGETPRVHRFILEASRQDPGSNAVIELVERTRALRLDSATGQIEKLTAVQSDIVPPAAMQIPSIAGVSMAETLVGWQEGGARTAHDNDAVSITSGLAPWGYAAQIAFNFTDDWVRGAWYWATLSVQVEAGQIGVSILMPNDKLKGERLINAGPLAVELVLPFTRTDAAVLIRNGGTPGRSIIKLTNMTIHGMPVPDARSAI
jgi:glycosyltransferase involved in cell wall biosynthesis